MRTLTKLSFAGKTVLYRPDYNVPLHEGVIADDYRIRRTLPTLDALREAGCKIIIASHLGRPDGQRNEEYSLRPVAQYLADHYTDAMVSMASEIDHDDVHERIDQMKVGDILVLPNVRFFPEEESNDKAFGKKLSSLADVYVDDAFAAVHRAHASIVRPPENLPAAAGLLLQEEVSTLTGLLEAPARPFVVIMGGAKVSDKIEVMKRLGQMADHVLVGGAMANTFLLAKGEDISVSKAEPDKVDVAKKLMTELGDKLVLASDYVKDEADDGSFRYLDIGPQAVHEFRAILSEAKTVFWNGSLGYAEDERFAVASEAIASFLAGLDECTTVVAGGDTVELVTRLELHDRIGFVSTGGGAALELLAGEKLPGVEALS